MRDITVVKCGGNAAVDPAAICSDIARMVHAGKRVVVVHGGSSDIRDLVHRLGVKERRITSPDGVTTRHTDAETLEVVTLALTGLAKPRLVTELVRAGVQAIGLTGLDGRLLTAKRKRAHRAIVNGRKVLVRDNHSGTVRGVNADLLLGLLDSGLTPIVSPPVLAEDGRPVNADADRVAAAVASALDASTLIMLTGAPGVLADATDDESLVPVVALDPEGPPPHLGGGMGMKLIAAREALRGGVRRVLIADGRCRRPVQTAGEAATEVVLDKAEAA